MNPPAATRSDPEIHFYPLPGQATITHIRPGVAALLLDAEGKILLHQRSDNGFWGLPGGGVEPGESVSAAILREVREETGLDATIERLLGVYSDPAQRTVVRYPDGNVVHYIVTCFVCRAAGQMPAPTANDESLALAWFSPGALPGSLVPAHALRIADFASGRAQVFLR